jgi:hypothetical protein
MLSLIAPLIFCTLALPESIEIMSGNDEISQLVKRLAYDDKQALDEIYRVYFPKLYLFSRKFLKVDDDIRDIVQEVFITIWKNRKKIKQAEAFDGYIFTVTKMRLSPTSGRK